MQFIKWFTLLLRKDMKNFEMDESESSTIYQQIRKSMKKTEEKKK